MIIYNRYDILNPHLWDNPLLNKDCFYLEMHTLYLLKMDDLNDLKLFFNSLYSQHYLFLKLLN